MPRSGMDIGFQVFRTTLELSIMYGLTDISPEFSGEHNCDRAEGHWGEARVPR
jgi:hypothetical protein